MIVRRRHKVVAVSGCRRTGRSHRSTPVGDPAATRRGRRATSGLCGVRGPARSRTACSSAAGIFTPTVFFGTAQPAFLLQPAERPCAATVAESRASGAVLLFFYNLIWPVTQNRSPMLGRYPPPSLHPIQSRTNDIFRRSVHLFCLRTQLKLNKWQTIFTHFNASAVIN